MLHEMAHNLGAVQGGAPNSTGTVDGDRGRALHRRVGRHVLRRRRPGQRADLPVRERSGPVTETFDCGGDDYFDPAPPADPGSRRTGTSTRPRCSARAPGTSPSRASGESRPPPRRSNPTPAGAAGWAPSPYAVTLAGTNATQWQWRVDGGPAGTTAAAKVGGGGVHMLETRVGSAADVWTSWRAETIRLDAAAPTVSLACIRTARPSTPVRRGGRHGVRRGRDDASPTARRRTRWPTGRRCGSRRPR